MPSAAGWCRWDGCESDDGRGRVGTGLRRGADVEINNTTNQVIDIYQYSGSAGVFLGTASPSVTRLSLVGTVAEYANGVMYAAANGKQVGRRRVQGWRPEPGESG